MSNEKLNEASYAGNIGMMELMKFHQKASPEQKKTLDSHIKTKKHKEAWDLVQNVTGTKLHKSVMEAIDIDIMGKAGAGNWGTDELADNYKRNTPGQTNTIKSFKEHIKK